MDDQVKAALAKWPNVPHCYGWLGLCERGNWWLRDDATQAAGGFASGLPHSKGSRLEHAGLIDFMGRNYACDGAGQWFFQNGPQRVYVELAAAPWVWRLNLLGAELQVTSHTGQVTPWNTVHLDEADRVFITTPLGLGLVHSQDVAVFAQWLEFENAETPPSARLPKACRHTQLLAQAPCVLSPHQALHNRFTPNT